MKILLVYPKNPVTYWSFDYALKFISRKSAFPPLGLLTVAGMLPAHYEKKLIDLNVKPLKDEDILWADYVFISAMTIQKKSAREIINRCKKLNIKVVAGGPLFSDEFDEFDDVDHLILKEGELTIPTFINDLENGIPKHFYSTNEWADLSKTPLPLWSLIDTKKYATLNIQYSRGCPFNCDFCEITYLYGQTPRTKDVSQLIQELNAIYDTGWRGGVFFVDDNFIGNKNKLKEEVLPAMINWMNERNNPFLFITEASINLADDEEMMRLMVKAGFNSVFIGIETPDEDSLTECCKVQNKNRELVECVKKIQNFGMQVQGGFIVGFDSDKENIFDKMINFIQKSGIVTAMVGILNAPKGTKLYNRMLEQGRLDGEFSGNNTSFSMNFVPKMDKEKLYSGYQKIIDTIYSPKIYYERVQRFLEEYNPVTNTHMRLKFNEVAAVLKSMVRLGVFGRERLYYWKLFFWTLFNKPNVLPVAVTLSIMGYHFRKVFEETRFNYKNLIV
jgi:radical SAM superfamily enzyme YgiQ (UPF0313 family)